MLVLLVSLLLLLPPSVHCQSGRSRVKIIAHRGIPCQFPEEIVEGYKHAIGLDVDFIEMDLLLFALKVSTKDGVLLTRHDLMLDGSTNIASSEFKGRNSTKVVAGKKQSGYFTIDFTLDEVKKLRSVQRLPFRDQSKNGLYQVPTLLEVLKLVRDARDKGSKVGLYIETKSPTYHKEHGRELEPLLVQALKEAKLLDPKAVYLESFEKSSLELLHKLLSKEGVKLPATWLLDSCTSPPTDEDLQAFTKIGTAIGPSKTSLTSIVPTPECDRGTNGTCDSFILGQFCIGRLENKNESRSELVERAHKAGLEVHPYTFRNEGGYMPLDFYASIEAELDFYGSTLGVDAVFVDCPVTALAWRNASQGFDDTIKPNDRDKLVLYLIIIFLIMADTVVVFFYCRSRRMLRAAGFSRVPIKGEQV